MAASSCRRSSESDTLELQEASLVLHAQRAVGAESSRGDHAVTGDDQTEAVVGAERSGGALSAGMACQASEVAVRNNFSVGDCTERTQHGELEGRPAADFQLDIVELGTFTSEVRLDPLNDFFRFRR